MATVANAPVADAPVVPAAPSAPAPAAPDPAPATPATPVETPKTTLTGEPATPAPEPKPTAPTPVAPVEYNLTLPEKATIDATALERTAAFAREQGLSAEAAQKSVEFLNAEITARESAYLESMKPGGAAWTDRITEFEALALKDPEVGGTPEKLRANAAEASRILKEVFPPSVSDFLHETGLGSSPDVLRGLLKIAKMTSEGKLVPGNAPAGNSEAEILRKRYDHPTSQTSRT